MSVVLAAFLLLCGCGAPTSSSTESPLSTAPVTPKSPTSATAAASSPLASARIVASKRLNDREEDLTIESPAVGGQVNVRLLLPVHFQAKKTQRWPVLYLFHGCCDNYLSWTRSTDIEQLTENLDVLVAMPDGGAVGFYSDWRSGPHWETFHTVELPKLLAEKYRATTTAAVAGLSMGGLGALDYAARHPGMFTVAASFSGIVHTRLSNSESQGYLGLVESEGQDPFALWGDPKADSEVWKQHNPYDLAPQLKGVQVFISAGNGQPGPLDSAGTSEDSIESQIGAENQAFAKRLKDLGMNAQIDLYGAGTHNWVYWERELHRAWPMITGGLGLR